MTAAWQRLTARGAERGSTESLELVIVAPILVILLVLGVAAGNIVRGNGAVDAAAASAARAASLQRSPDTAEQAGQAAAAAALADRGLECTDVQVDVDTSEFDDRTPGASVRATVHCTLPLAKYAIPGFPGSMTITDVGVSPIDVFRERATS